MPEYVTVQVSDGALRGRRAVSRAGGSYCSFQGVPYAKPPVGPLRFKVAEPPEPWSGVRDALAEPSTCTQFSMFTLDFEGVEDSLYLNVYSPQLPGPGVSSKPVMVWIHGGGFISGSGNTDLYGPDFLVDAGVVLVTFNYRLGVLGFLSVDGPVASGNVGLKDQVAALRWVQKNVASFGGDPGNVTIFGESAGGASVNFHMLSPLSRGLFHRAIAQSGSAVGPWALEHHPREMAFRLGAALGCTTEDPQQLVDFLRTVDHMKLVMTATQQGLSDQQETKRLIRFAFVATVDHSFLPDDPTVLLEQGRFHPVPYITGVTSDEGILLTKYIDFASSDMVKRINEEFEKIIMPDIRLPEGYSRGAEVCSKIWDFYMKDKPYSKDTLLEFLQMQADVQFCEGIRITLDKMAEKGLAPVYNYCFTVDGRLNMFKILMELNFAGSCHADDLGYLFRVQQLDPDLAPDSGEARTRARMVAMWTNFAKTGNPSPDGGALQWQPYTTSCRSYLEIGDELSLKKNLFQERMTFWDELYKSS